MRRGLTRINRFTIVPSEGPGLRSHIAEIVSSGSNLALAVTPATFLPPELPEDRAPGSGIMVRNHARNELADTLNGPIDDTDDIFDRGLAVEGDEQDNQVSGPYSRENLLDGVTGLEADNDIAPTPTAPKNIDGKWEFYPPAIPAAAAYVSINAKDIVSVPPPAPAAPMPLVKIKEPVLVELSETEIGLLERAEILARAIEHFPRTAVQRVAATVAVVDPKQRKLFWDMVYRSRQQGQINKNETTHDIVVKHTSVIEAIAYQVIRHERSQNCYHVVALELGFQCLPRYADINFKYVLHAALRTKVESLREIGFINPLELTVLTPDTIYMLAPEHRTLAEAVIKTINTGIESKQTELQVLIQLASLAPSQREIIWHFYHLLKKPDTTVKSMIKASDTAAVYRAKIANIADQLIAAMNGQWRRVDGFINIGFQLLPQNVDPKTKMHLRVSLQKAVNARIQQVQESSKLGNLAEGDRKVLEGLANELINRFRAEPFNVEKVVQETVGMLNTVQKAALIDVLKPAITKLRAQQTITIRDKAALASQLIAQAPQRKEVILDEVAKGLTPVEIIVFHEAMGASVLNSHFGDHKRTSILPQTSQSNAPLFARRIDDQNIQAYRDKLYHGKPLVEQTPTTPPTAVSTVSNDIEKLPDDGYEKITSQPKNFWQSITSTLRRGAQHLSSWWSSVKTTVSEFSFMNFVHNHPRTVAATTVMAALNGYQGYQDVTRVAEVASAPTTTMDAPWEKPQAVRVQTAAFSQPMGVAEDGRRRLLNYAPVTVSTTEMQWHHHGLFAPANLRLATATESRSMTPAGYEPVTTLHGQKDLDILSPWEFRVDQHDAMANIFNALNAYMQSNSFKLVYANYVPGPQDQSQLFANLLSYNPRAHHILHRIAHGDMITFGTNVQGNIAIISWFNAQGVNMLAGEPAIIIRTAGLANLGEFSRSPNALARRTSPQATEAAHTLAMLTPSQSSGTNE